jgi:DNA-binding NarL/FixJ family response regulator
MNPILLLADDNMATCSALAFALETRLGLCVAGEAASMRELLPLVERLQPHLLILDWELPGLGEGGGIAALRALSPGLKIVALSSRSEARDQALESGADAFASMVEPPEALFCTIRGVAGPIL